VVEDMEEGMEEEEAVEWGLKQGAPSRQPFKPSILPHSPVNGEYIYYLNDRKHIKFKYIQD